MNKLVLKPHRNLKMFLMERNCLKLKSSHIMMPFLNLKMFLNLPPFLTSRLLIYSLLLVLASCEEDTKIELPDEALNVPNQTGLEDKIFATTAREVNDNNLIIGWTSPSERPFQRLFERVNGFVINSDNTGHVPLNAPDAFATFPTDINNQNYIVGSYVSNQMYEEHKDDYDMPARAFLIHSNGEGFKDLHVEGYEFSGAEIIAGNNQVAIRFGNDFEAFTDQHYALYDIDNDSWLYLDSTVFPRPQILTMNEKYLVLTDPEKNRYYDDITNAAIFTYPELVFIESIPMDQIPSDMIEFSEMNSNHQLVGNYVDTTIENFGFQGFTYSLGDFQLRFIEMGMKIGESRYVDFKPEGINDDGLIAGTAGRLNKDFIYPQSRAFVMDWDLSNYDDITPPNRNTYSEAYDVNNFNLVVGYAGFMQKRHSTIIDRAFVVTY